MWLLAKKLAYLFFLASVALPLLVHVLGESERTIRRVSVDTGEPFLLGFPLTGSSATHQMQI